MKLRWLREGDVLEDGDITLVRGGELGPDVLREDALRYHSSYGVYGSPPSPFAAPRWRRCPAGVAGPLNLADLQDLSVDVMALTADLALVGQRIWLG